MISDDRNSIMFMADVFSQDALTAALNAVRLSLGLENRTKSSIDAPISRLCELIEKQFAREEQGGYMRAVIDASPRLQPQIALLLEEHQLLLEQGEKLRMLIHSGVELPSWWVRVESDFEQLATALSNHDRAENTLLQKAFAQELGSKD